LYVNGIKLGERRKEALPASLKNEKYHAFDLKNRNVSIRDFKGFS
jgi:hypothetical protein